MGEEAKELTDAQIDRLVEAGTLWRPHCHFGHDPRDPESRWTMVDGAGSNYGNYSRDQIGEVCKKRNREAFREALLATSMEATPNRQRNKL